jgi:hypothetical protein
MVDMIWTGWNNSEHHSTGAGYGLKITAVDRDRHFKRTWQTVFIELPSGDGFIIVEANVTKQSFWGPQCRELISRYIGRWMLDEGYAPWPDDMPPKFEVESFGDWRFRVKKGLAA